MPLGEDTPTKASSPYGAAKAAAENYCFAYADSYGLDVTVLRLFNVYGPLMTKYVIHDFVRKLQRDSDRLVILGDGNQVRDYLYVDDAVDAFLLAAERGTSGGVYNVGSGMPVCIRDLAFEIIRVMGLKDVEVEYTMETWPGDIQAWYADVSKISALGFVPRISWGEGLRRTVEFFVEYPVGVNQ
jgi:UDP-glucose 4-epimerase